MKHLAENINNTLFELILTIFFWMFSPLAKATKEKKKKNKTKQVGLHQTEKLSYSERNHQQNRRQPIE